MTFQSGKIQEQIHIWTIQEKLLEKDNSMVLEKNLQILRDHYINVLLARKKVTSSNDSNIQQVFETSQKKIRKRNFEHFFLWFSKAWRKNEKNNRFFQINKGKYVRH